MKQIILASSFLLLFNTSLAQDHNSELQLKVYSRFLIKNKLRPFKMKKEFELIFDSSGVILLKKRDALYLLGSGPYNYQTQFSYKNGNLISENKIADHFTCRNAYFYSNDLLIKSTSISINNSDTTYNDSEFKYDSLNRLVNRYDKSEYYSYENDNSGRVIRERYFIGNELRSISTYTYSQDTTLILHDLVFSNEGKTLEMQIYKVNKLQKLLKLSTSSQKQSATKCDIFYDEYGVVSKIVHSVSVASNDFKIQKTYYFKLYFKKTPSRTSVNAINTEIFNNRNDFLDTY